MRNSSSGTASMDGHGASISFPVPIRDGTLFKHSASAAILNFLTDNPAFELSVRQLSRLTDVSARATADAVDALAANELVEVRHEGNARLVGINRDRLQDPADPTERIPQPPYRTPVRVITQYVMDELENVLGIVLFGSVARGDADRQSDIDLWVLVEDNILEQRNTANHLRRDLADLQIPPKIALKEAQGGFESNWPTIRKRLEADETEWASADRHAVEFVVETPESIRQQSDRVDAQQLFGDGITLVDSKQLDEIKLEVLEDE